MIFFFGETKSVPHTFSDSEDPLSKLVETRCTKRAEWWHNVQTFKAVKPS